MYLVLVIVSGIGRLSIPEGLGSSKRLGGGGGNPRRNSLDSLGAPELEFRIVSGIPT